MLASRVTTAAEELGGGAPSSSPPSPSRAAISAVSVQPTSQPAPVILPPSSPRSSLFRQRSYDVSVSNSLAIQKLEQSTNSVEQLALQDAMESAALPASTSQARRMDNHEACIVGGHLQPAGITAAPCRAHLTPTRSPVTTKRAHMH